MNYSSQTRFQRKAFANSIYKSSFIEGTSARIMHVVWDGNGREEKLQVEYTVY